MSNSIGSIQDDVSPTIPASVPFEPLSSPVNNRPDDVELDSFPPPAVASRRTREPLHRFFSVMLFLLVISCFCCALFTVIQRWEEDSEKGYLRPPYWVTSSLDDIFTFAFLVYPFSFHVSNLRLCITWLLWFIIQLPFRLYWYLYERSIRMQGLEPNREFPVIWILAGDVIRYFITPFLLLRPQLTRGYSLYLTLASSFAFLNAVIQWQGIFTQLHPLVNLFYIPLFALCTGIGYRVQSVTKKYEAIGYLMLSQIAIYSSVDLLIWLIKKLDQSDYLLTCIYIGLYRILYQSIISFVEPMLVEPNRPSKRFLSFFFIFFDEFFLQIFLFSRKRADIWFFLFLGLEFVRKICLYHPSINLKLLRINNSIKRRLRMQESQETEKFDSDWMLNLVLSQLANIFCLCCTGTEIATDYLLKEKGIGLVVVIFVSSISVKICTLLVSFYVIYYHAGHWREELKVVLLSLLDNVSYLFLAISVSIIRVIRMEMNLSKIPQQ